MCLLCSASKEGIDDPFINNTREFQISMMDAPCQEPCCCLYGCCCMWCAACTTRNAVLEGDLDKYECCQAYVPGCCCFKPGSMGEKSCPHFCLCLEGCCCPTLSVSTSRIYVQDALSLASDPMDIRLIRCSNCLQILSCICNIAAIFCSELRELAQIIDCIADIFTAMVTGCMVGQVHRELEVLHASGAQLSTPETKTMIKRGK